MRRPIFTIKSYDDGAVDIQWVTGKTLNVSCYGADSIGRAILIRLGLEDGAKVSRKDDAYPTLLILTLLCEAYEPWP